MKYYNNRNNHHNNHHSAHNGNGNVYIWKLSWWNSNTGDHVKTFKSKQQALMLKCKLENNYSNCYIELKKWFG